MPELHRARQGAQPSPFYLAPQRSRAIPTPRLRSPRAQRGDVDGALEFARARLASFSRTHRAGAASADASEDAAGEGDGTAAKARSKRLCRRGDDGAGDGGGALAPDDSFDAEICEVMGLLAYEPEQLAHDDCPLAHLAGAGRVEKVVRLLNRAILAEATAAGAGDAQEPPAATPAAPRDEPSVSVVEEMLQQLIAIHEVRRFLARAPSVRSLTIERLCAAGSNRVSSQRTTGASSDYRNTPGRTADCPENESRGGA